MSPELPTCRIESEIVAAARSGLWTEELRAHLGSCDLCAATVATVCAFQADAERQTVTPAGLALWRIRLRERRELEKDLARPLVWGERIAAILAVVGAIAISLFLGDKAAWVGLAGAVLALIAASAVAVSWWAGDRSTRANHRVQ
jgi:hypothetical protein